jgi:hypothetical protein
MKFFYQISCYYAHGSRWDVAYKGVITADNKKAAKLELNKIFDTELKEKVSRGKENPEFKLFIIELTPEWEEFWESDRECSVCKSSYSILKSYQAGSNATKVVCSDECFRAHRKPSTPDFLEEGYNNTKPCIYKITNKNTKMVYIGKTTRPFTLRWWQHFYHPGETKFHKAILESELTDWIFEVVEVITLDNAKDAKSSHKQILDREQFYINLHRAISNGYNSVASVSEDTE